MSKEKALTKGEYEDRESSKGKGNASTFRTALEESCITLSEDDRGRSACCFENSRHLCLGDAHKRLDHNRIKLSGAGLAKEPHAVCARKARPLGPGRGD